MVSSSVTVPPVWLVLCSDSVVLRYRMATQQTCHTGSSTREVRSLEGIVKAYCQEFRKKAEQLLRYYARQPSLKQAIEKAGWAKLPSGKRHPHQYRLSNAALCRATEVLLHHQDKLQTCISFDELHALVDQLIGGIRGIGPLMVYDTAHRLGAYLQLEPRRVYLHRGTAEGAAALGFSGRKTLEMHELPKALRSLRPYEAEDCLCIYKDALRQLSVAW